MAGASRVVVIEHDEWLMRLLVDGLRDAGFGVTASTTAEEGVALVRETVPDCILCDVNVSGGGGYEVAREIRQDQPPLSLTPIAILAADDDLEARTKTFEAGGDALITRPFRLDEVVAQLTALVQLAHRMRARRTSLIDSLRAGPPSAPESASFRGDLEHMPLASLLTLLELERKTGGVSVRSGKRRATIELADGHVAGGAIDGATMEPVSVLRDALSWREGEITFRARAAAPRPPNARAIRLLLAEARGSSAAIPAMRGSSSRLPAIPPPPGQRRSAGSPIKTPALQETPTQRVDVPEKPRRS